MSIVGELGPLMAELTKVFPNFNDHLAATFGPQVAQAVGTATAPAAAIAQPPAPGIVNQPPAPVRPTGPTLTGPGAPPAQVRPHNIGAPGHVGVSGGGAGLTSPGGAIGVPGTYGGPQPAVLGPVLQSTLRR
jgi:hypothetical protein